MLIKDASASRSLPTLPAAFNLRQYARTNRPMEMDRALSVPKVPLETVKDRERRRKQAESIVRWKQIEEDERGLQAEAKKLRLIQLEKKRAKELLQQQKLEAIQLAKSNAAYRAMMAEVERKQKERDEQDRREREERERIRREAEERERQRRMPWTCDLCEGTGKCVGCLGAGVLPSLYFTPNVTNTSSLEFGRKPQGCEVCGGYSPGVTGKMTQGNGLCTKCGGPGKIWPVLENRKSMDAPCLPPSPSSKTTDASCMLPSASLVQPVTSGSEPASPEALPD